MSNSAPRLRDLFGFSLPKITSNFDADDVTYTLECDSDELNNLKTAISNANNLLHSGIESISYLLTIVEMHCHDEIDRHSKIHALALITEMSEILRLTLDAGWTLDRAKSSEIQKEGIGDD